MPAQWDQMAPLSRERAMRVVNQLRKGVPPGEDVAVFSIGREDLLSYFDSVLEEIASYDQQGIKFLQADYGHGKTHFLDMLGQLALGRNFVVSFVSLDREQAPFNKLEKVLPLIMAGVTTASSRPKSGLSYLLQEWAGKVKGNDKNTVLQMLVEAEGLYLLSPDFRLKLAEYARSYNGPNGPAYEECLQIEKWFRGEESKSKTFTSVPGFLAAFVQFVRFLGYNGFVVMLDEAESITLLSRITNRDQANENLRQILDNQELRGFYFVFASTPSFLSGEDDRGANAYPALWRRIMDPLPRVSLRALDKVIVELPPLSAQEYGRLALRIRDIYEIAYHEQLPQVTEADLERLANYVMVRADKSVRTLVRSTVALLDEARSDSTLDVSSYYELIVERVLADEERQRAL